LFIRLASSARDRTDSLRWIWVRAVTTEAGRYDKVAALAYVTAFAPDKGKPVNTLTAGFPADGPRPPTLPRRTGSCS
jgi:hypothetical protein